MRTACGNGEAVGAGTSHFLFPKQQWVKKLSIERYRTFIVAAKCETFFKAADELYITPATVSKHIAALEKELGVVLFTRTPQGVVLTEEGKKRLPLMQQLVRTYDSLIGGNSEPEAPCELTVVVGPPPSRFGIEKIVRGFAQYKPDIKLRIQEIRGTTDAVISGDSELGFLNVGHLDPQKLQWIVIEHTPLGIVLPADHAFAKRESVSLRELRGEQFIFPAPEIGVLARYIDICHKCGFTPKINNYGYRDDSILFYVSCGAGIAFFTRELYNRFNYDNTAFVPLEEKFYATGVLARSRNRVLSTKAFAFWDYVRKNYSIKIE